MLIDLAIVFAIAYLIGSIPFGLILTRMAGLGDIRAIGSGNIGATNVMRTGKKWLGLLVFLLDAAKGVVALVATYQYAEYAAALAYPNEEDAWVGLDRLNIIVPLLALGGISVVVGHIFPLWLKFRGGKGVATAFGVLLTPALFDTQALPFAAVICGAWLLAFFTTRMVSIASLAAMWMAPLAGYYFDTADTAYFCLAVALLITYTHRENIGRIISGTEHKFGKKP